MSEINLSAIRSFLEAFDRTDLDAMGKLLHDEAELTLNGVLVVRKDLDDHYRGFWAAFKGFHHEIIELNADGDFVQGRYVVTAEHAGTFADANASGASIKIPTKGKYRLENGLLREGWVDFDMSALMSQISS